MAMVRRFDMEDGEIRAVLDRRWAASDASDFEAEHQIYRQDAPGRLAARPDQI